MTRDRSHPAEGDIEAFHLTLAQPLAAGRLRIPGRIRVARDRVIYRWTNHPRSRATGLRLLEEFARLRDASDARILRFAETWGVLNVCRHNVPLARHGTCRPSAIKGGESCEPLWLWRDLAEEVASVLGLRASLEGGRKPAQGDLGIFVPRLAAEYVAGTRSERWRLLVSEVDFLLLRGGVRPVLAWTGESIQASLGFDGVYGAVAAQLFTVVTGSGLAFCSKCGEPFVPRRSPTSGKRVYCGRCRRAGHPEADAARDYRRRKKESL